MGLYDRDYMQSERSDAGHGKNSGDNYRPDASRWYLLLGVGIVLCILALSSMF